MKYNISNIKSKTTYHSMADPESTTTTISFGGIALDPAPFVSLNIEKYTAGDYTIGGVMNVTLNGVYHGADFSVTSQKLKQEIESLASKHKCLNDIKIECGSGNPIISSGIGFIRSYSFPEGEQRNWMNIIPYTIELVVLKSNDQQIIEPDTKLNSRYSLTNKYIKSLKENISYSLDDKIFQTYAPSGTDPGANHKFSNAHIIVKYNLEVQGMSNCGCTGIDVGISAAYDIINYRNNNIQNLDGNFLICNTGHFFPSGDFDITKRFNHTRNIQVNELEGIVSVDGEFILRPTGVIGNVLLTMDSNADLNIENGEKTITINGTIQGLHENTFSDSNLSKTNADSIKLNAMNAAEQRLYELLNNDSRNIIDYLKTKNNLMTFESNLGEFKNDDNAPKALGFGNDEEGNSGYAGYLGSDEHEYRLMNKVFKRNHTNSSIDFTLTYSNRNKYKIDGALWADINIEHELPAKRLVEHVVPGRGYPITQDIQCDTLDTFAITYNAQFEPSANIHKIIGSARQTILTYMNETATALNITNWIRTSDNETIGNNGSYRRTMKFTRHSCFDGSSSSSALTYVKMNPGGSDFDGVVNTTTPTDPVIEETWDPDTPTQPISINSGP